jgi:hypothetical protein
MVDLDRRVGSNTLGLGGPKARPHQKTATPPLARCEPGKPAVRTNHNSPTLFAFGYRTIFRYCSSHIVSGLVIFARCTWATGGPLGPILQ